MPVSVPIPPAPPVAIVADAARGAPAAIIRTYSPGAPQCGGESVAAERKVEPAPDGLYLAGDISDAWHNGRITLRFDIAADGRPIGIRREPVQPRYGLDLADDVEPAFAAWRFASGSPRSQCTIGFDSRDVPVAEAEPQLLYFYLATRASAAFGFAPQPVTDAARARIRPAGATCAAQPGSRIWYWPDFDKIPQPAGTMSWSFLGFDVDSHGKARGARLLGSSGNADLDRRSVSALEHSVFTQPATGCTFNFFRNPGEPMPAPPPKGELSAYREEKATCEGRILSGPDSWARMAPLEFPRNLARRAIQGWAVVSYDVAPWGQTGNVRVVESQPASGFGEAAQRIVEQSQRRPAAYGYTGCLERVAFVLPPRGPRVR